MTKPTKWHVCPAKTQISLGVRSIWSVFAICLKKPWVLSYPLSDQTGRMSRLIWVFARHTCHFVGFVMSRLIWFWFQACQIILFRLSKFHGNSDSPSWLFSHIKFPIQKYFLTYTGLTVNRRHECRVNANSVGDVLPGHLLTHALYNEEWNKRLFIQNHLRLNLLIFW